MPLERRALLRFALAHHPTCTMFAADLRVARFRSLRTPLCVGCTVFWPSFLLGLPLVLWVAAEAALSWWTLLVSGCALATVQFLSFTSFTASRSAKSSVKGVLGVAGAIVIACVALAPWPGLARLAFGIALVLVAGAVQTLRFKKIFKTCAQCPWQKEWQFCPGFAPINDYAPGRGPSAYAGRAEDLPRAWPWTW